MIDHRRHGPFDDESPDVGDHLPPNSLQYKGFSRFLDIFRGLKNVPGMEKTAQSSVLGCRV